MTDAEHLARAVAQWTRADGDSCRRLFTHIARLSAGQVRAAMTVYELGGSPAAVDHVAGILASQYQWVSLVTPVTNPLVTQIGYSRVMVDGEGTMARPPSRSLGGTW